ncbi:sensor histidine kinase [Streptomyces niger]|uniref:sensor histidine kinase n=1 Tax=Streptomyces niger TaxID=66373 RepID=UPI000B1FD7BF|nr:ATP-binding protein [Streptomyces niger]
MVRADASPGRPGPATAMWLLPPSLLAICTTVAASSGPPTARPYTVWAGIVATTAVAVAAIVAARRGRALDTLRKQYAAREDFLQRQLAQQEIETVRLANETLPTALARMKKGTSVDEVVRTLDTASLVSPGFDTAHRRVVRRTLQAVEIEGDLRSAAQQAFVNIARRVQAIVHQQALEVREMEDRHGRDRQVYNDLLHLDHRTALVGRLADSIAVLGGARPGRQWQKDIPLFNVLRGAMSRITDYRRVDLHSVADVGIIGRGAEPLIHAVAELLDNATRYSPPRTRVHLTASEVQSGVAVEIEDAGLGLTDEARRRAEEALAQSTPGGGLDLNDLGEAPRLGLAVVGRLAKANNFKVSLRKSAYGGVRVVLIVPPETVTVNPVPGGDLIKAAVLPPHRHVPAYGLTRAPQPPVEEAAPTAVRRNANGLPQRKRRTRALSPYPRPQTASRRADSRSPESADAPPEAGLWMSAFLDGVSGDSHADSPTESPAPRPHGLSDDESEQ